MQCPKCGSENVNVQVVSETHLSTKHHGVVYWLFVGWWWIPVKWIFLTVPALIVKIFSPKNIKLKQSISLNVFAKIVEIPGMLKP